MRVPQIQITSTNAQIELHTNNAKIDVDQNNADLSIEQKPADLVIDIKPAKLTIDQTKARADVDLKSIALRIEEFSQKGKQKLIKGIQRRVQQGEQLMKIENDTNPLSVQAKQNSQNPMKEFGLGFVPSAGGVDVHYEPSTVQTRFTTHEPNINVKINKPILDYKSGRVDIDLLRKNEIEINFEMIDIKA